MTRAIVAMAGTFGYELDPRLLSAQEKAMIRDQIKIFNRYYDLIQKGRYLRLSDEQDEQYYTSWGFVSGDRSEALVSLVVTDVRANPEVNAARIRGRHERQQPHGERAESSGVFRQLFQRAAHFGAAL